MTDQPSENRLLAEPSDHAKLYLLYRRRGFPMQEARELADRMELLIRKSQGPK